MSLRKDFVADECRCGREIALRVTTGCGGDRYHSGGFLLRIMPPSWHPVPACTPRRRYRRAVLLCRNDSSRRAILSCSSDRAAVIPKSRPEIKNRCSLWAILEVFLAAIPKSGPEIKNHCTLEGVSWQKPAAIPKLTPSNQESLHATGLKRGKPCSDSQV